MSSSIKIREVTPDLSLPDSFSGCFTYWKSLSDSGVPPRFAAFQLDQLSPRLLPWSIVVDVLHDPTDYLFRFWGTERTKLIGVEMTGKHLSDISDKNMRDGNRLEYDAICKQRVPMLCDTPIVTSTGRRLSHVSLRLPFGDDEGNISHVFSAIDPEEVTSEHYRHFGTEPHIGTRMGL